MSTSIVLIASCSENVEPVSLVKDILSRSDLPECTNPLEDIQAYPWHVDTKYYTADVLLCTTVSRTIGNKDFADSVEAVLLCFDSDNKDSFNQVKSWIPFTNEINPEVRMLICEKSLSSHVIPREFVQEWCLDYNFELVELSPEDEDDPDDLEDDFMDSFGVKRIIQALHAHTWPNMKIKDQPNVRSPYFQNLMKEQAAENAKQNQDKSGQSSSDAQVDRSDPSSVPLPTCVAGSSQAAGHRTERGERPKGITEENSSATGCGDSIKQMNKEKEKNNMIDSLLSSEESAMFDALAIDGDDEDSFEKLFSQLSAMKERCSTIPPEQRKAYAEQVALSFWRSVGGDEDEIANLSDSSND